MHDQQIFDMTLPERLQQPYHTTEKWLNTNEEYLLRSISRETMRLKNKNHNITKFFCVTKPSVHPHRIRTTSKIKTNTSKEQTSIQTYFQLQTPQLHAAIQPQEPSN
jgi:hypothetical protein